MMLLRTTLGKSAPRAALQLNSASGRRAASSFQFAASEAAGIKIATREVAGPTGALALAAKAGTRYEPLPGYSDALAHFAFKVGLNSRRLQLQLSCSLFVNWSKRGGGGREENQGS